MSREAHVRFCEGLRGRFPRATRLVILVDAHPRHAWLKRAVPLRLPDIPHLS